MFNSKPIIGILGGIGSGKSAVARAFGELGCLVIDSDELVNEAYRANNVREKLVEWWGSEILSADGGVNRKAIANHVFTDENQRRRLEGLLHPLVAQLRDERMKAAGDDTVAFVWDTPLLLETGLDRQCDALVFVEAPDEVRRERVTRERGWTAEEWERREKLQQPLDKKVKAAKYMVSNTAGTGQIRQQVSRVLSRIVNDLHDGDRRKA